MSRKPRIYYTETDKALMWDRWRKGDSLQAIAQLFDRSHGSVAGILSRTGGIRPPKRMRSRRALSIAEREEISRGVVAGRTLRSIAASLSRAPSTISREIKRNGGRQHYRANLADEAVWDLAHRLKTCKLIRNRALAGIVANKLQIEWSPRQMAGLIGFLRCKIHSNCWAKFGCKSTLDFINNSVMGSFASCSQVFSPHCAPD